MRIFLILFILKISFIREVVSSEIFSVPVDTTYDQAYDILEKLHNQAMAEYRHGNYRLSESFFKKIIDIRERFMPFDSIDLAEAYVNLGAMYSKNWNFEEAFEYYDKAENIFKAIENRDIHIAKVLINKGNILMRMGDPLKAISYYEHSEKILKSNLSEDIVTFEHLYSNLAIGLITAKHYEEALKYLKKALNHRDDKVTLKRIYHHYTNIYRETKDLKSAEKYYRLLFEVFKNEHDVYKVYFNYGYFLIFYNIDPERGLEYVNAGLEYYDKNKINSPLFKAFAMQITGYYHEQKGNLDKALMFYQQAIILVSDDFHNTDISANPAYISSTYDGRILIYLKNKARALLKYYENTQDTRYLEYAFNSSRKAIEVINRMRFRYTSEASNFLISEKEKFTFDFAEILAHKLYSITGNVFYLEEGFAINEQGRAFSLLSAIRKLRATEFGDIPAKVRAEERDLNRQLSLYDELIFQEKQSPSPDSAKIMTWKSSLFEVEQDYENFIKRLEKEFPNYYSLKYDHHITTPVEIMQKIGHNTALLEYSILDSVLLIYYVNKEKAGVISVGLDPGFENMCNKFSSVITKQSFSAGVRETYKNYTNLGYELYKILIEPVEDNISAENLIIIPDGSISYVPFDALLTQKVNSEKLDYRNLPYLIRGYSAGYSYSATFHFNPIRHVSLHNKSLLAFAPSYENDISTADEATSSREREISQLYSLPGVKEEVNRIARIIEADVFTDDQATERNFKALADHYRILHLAMHTLIDDENPMFSKLAFSSQAKDTIEDNFLHTYEIYNMKFNANLAVLSSCSSGYGKMQVGEGIQSLARAFAYAGCPSILMTLWEVADMSTVFVMDKFYAYLKNHDPLPVALRKAKLDFLSNADMLNSNPFFWSSYVVIGDSSPLYPYNPGTHVVNILLLILPISISGIFYKRYTREQKRKKLFY